MRKTICSQFQPAIVFLSFWLFATIAATAQSKPPVTPESYKRWSTLDGRETQLSYSGKYFAYLVSDQLKTKVTTHFCAVDKSWEKTFEGLSNFKITNLGKREVGLALKKDSLWIITLGTGATILKTNIQSVSLSKAGRQEGYSVDRSNWILIEKKDKSIELVNAQNEKILLLDSVKQCRFEQKTETPIVAAKDLLLKINPSLSIDTIYQFESSPGFLEAITYSTASRKSYIQVVEAKQRKIIEVGTPNRVLISKESIDAGYNFYVAAGILSLVDNDSTLLFYLSSESNIDNKIVDKENTSLVLWTYLDDHASLRPDPRKSSPVRIAYAYNLFSDQVFALENDSIGLGSASGEWAIVNKRPQLDDFGVNLLRTKEVQPLQAISVKSKRHIYTNIVDSTIRGISPLKKYVLYQTNGTLSIFTLNSEKHHEVLRLTEAAPTQTNEPRHVLLAGWSPDNDTLYFYYNYDIYMASCANGFPTRNLTLGYGARNKTCFMLLTGLSDRIILYKDIKYLIAKDYKNMEDGFYVISPGTNALPRKLEFGPVYYGGGLWRLPPSLGPKDVPYPIKARGSDSYLVTRSSVNEAPNLFFTKDFMHLTQLTYINPGSKYNGMKSELIQYEMPDKMIGNGILYRPENFDSTRKYPLIISSYSEASPYLNAYIEPTDVCNYCLPSIPTYVSNGYMVFVPDIYSPKGKTLKAAVETVKASLKALSRFKQIDMERVGIAGCSFSGVTTEFILTQVKGLKAAVASSALANPISGFNMLIDDGFASTWYLKGQGNFGVSLFENPQLYIDNASILQADKIQAPLLIMHTTNDDRCPFYDAQQFFVALRNLNKKVWLLEYRKGIHGVFESDMPDFGLRMRQFFDHYLMDKPAPAWMTQKTIDRLKGLRKKDLSVKLKIDPSQISASR
ncbi:alpha/beta hydrolase family protein [Chitinophaga lutea]